MLSFYFSPITHECILFYKLSLQKWTDSLLSLSMKMERKHRFTPDNVWISVNLKLDRDMWEKNKMSPHPVRGIRKGWEEKSCSIRALYERIGPIRAWWVPGRGALLIPGGFAMEFLRSWSEPGVALRLKLRFDLSPTASHATAITHRPLISIFRPARPSRPSSPLLLLLLHRDRRYSSGCVTRCCYDLDPIDRHELIVPQILHPL